LPSPNDPIQVWTQRQRWIIAVGAILALAVGAWAMWTPRTAIALEGTEQAKLASPQVKPTDEMATTSTDTTVTASAFTTVRLWNPPPPPPAPPSQVTEKPEDVRPPKLQLIGIIQQAGGEDGGAGGGGGGDGALHAAIYDIDEDRLLILRSGDRVRQFTITAIDDKAVELTDGRRTTRLALQPEVPAT